MDTILPSQPENYRQLISRSIALYKLSFKKVIFLAFLLAFTAFIPRFLSDLIGQDIFLNLTLLSPYRLWLLLINLGALLFVIAIFWRLHCLIHHINEPLVDDFRVGIKKVLSVFIATLIESVLLFAIAIIIYGIQLLLLQKDALFTYYASGMITTFIVFLVQLFAIVYIATLFFFLVPIIAIENNGILSALERSIRLVWNHWWRVFSLQMTPWLAYAVLLVLIRFVLRINIHIYFIEHGTHTVWTTILHLIIFTLFIPWVAALVIVQLKDLELRKKIASSL